MTGSLRGTAPRTGALRAGVPRGAAGFTLVEVVVVLVILGITAVVAVPAFRSPARPGDLDLAAERVQLLLRIARDSALKTAQPVTVVVDSVSSLVWITTPTSTAMATDLSNPGAGGVGGMRAPIGDDRAPVEPSGPGSSLDLPPSVRMAVTSSRARFEFRPGGTAFGDTIHLIGGTGERRVTLNPRTGHAIVD